jgi:hypothetical protein
MKDHLSVLNPLARAGKNMGPDAFPVHSPDQPFQPGSSGNPWETGSGDRFDSPLQVTGFYDEAEIEGMDVTAAMEYTKFIREQSLLPQGSQQMEHAHQTISPQWVARLLGNA